MVPYDKKIVQAEELFYKLQGFKKEDGRVTDYVNGISRLVMKQYGWSQPKTSIMLDLLERNGYCQKIWEGRLIIALTLLRNEWIGLPCESIKEKKPKILRETVRKRTVQIPHVVESQISSPPAPQKLARRYLILADWSNIEESEEICSPRHVVSKILSVEKTLAEEGTIEAKFVFVPEHRAEFAVELSTVYRYFLIYCPRSLVTENNEVIFKIKDTVDGRLGNLGMFAAFFGDLISDIAIVGGDGDFCDMASYAKDHKKRVTVASYAHKLSSALRERADEVIYFH